MSTTHRSRFRQFNDKNAKSKDSSRRPLSYHASSGPLDVMSLLTPSAKTRFANTASSTVTHITAEVPRRRTSATKLIYSINTGDGSEIKTEPVKRKVFGRSSIYGALEAALGQEDNKTDEFDTVPIKRNCGVAYTSRNTETDIAKVRSKPKSRSEVVTNQSYRDCNDQKTEIKRDIPHIPKTNEAKISNYKRFSCGRSSLGNDCESRTLEEMSPKTINMLKDGSAVRARVRSFSMEKATVRRRVLPVTPAEDICSAPDISPAAGVSPLSVRLVSYENISTSESVCLKASDSDDSGCEACYEDSLVATPEPKQNRVASVTSIDSLLGPRSPRYSTTSLEQIPNSPPWLSPDQLHQNLPSTPDYSPDQIHPNLLSTSGNSLDHGLDKKNIVRYNMSNYENNDMNNNESNVKGNDMLNDESKNIVTKGSNDVSNNANNKVEIEEEVKILSPPTAAVKRISTDHTVSRYTVGIKANNTKNHASESVSNETSATRRKSSRKEIFEFPDKIKSPKSTPMVQKTVSTLKSGSSIPKMVSKMPGTVSTTPQAMSTTPKAAEIKSIETSVDSRSPKSTKNREINLILDMTINKERRKPVSVFIEQKKSMAINVEQTKRKLSSDDAKKSPATSVEIKVKHPVISGEKVSISNSGPVDLNKPTSPEIPISPLVNKLDQLSQSPISSSDESDLEWRNKIMSARNFLTGGVTLPKSDFHRDLNVPTILEGHSDYSEAEQDEIGDLPSFKTSSRPQFSRQYSSPVQSPKKQQSIPLQPGRRKKSLTKTKRKSSIPEISKPPDLKPINLPQQENNFDSLDITSPVLQSPFRNDRVNIRPQRRNTTSQNPVKLIQEREKQSKELAKEQEEKENAENKKGTKSSAATAHWKKANNGARLAASAINGLQMKIDFASAALKLRKTEKHADGTAKASIAAGEESTIVSKFPDKMLLQLKGRKNVQCCLVECKVSSLNSGDVFLLLAKQELFQFVGQDANVHEKAKGNDLVDRIVRNKEMGCTATKSVTLREQDMDMCKRDFKRFFELLDGRPPIAEKETVMDDREFERKFQQEARVTRFKEEDEEKNSSFVPVNTGKRLRYEILNPKDTFVLDFVTEYYIWCGKGVPMSTRKKALLLAEQLYKEECTVNKPPQVRRASVALTAGALQSTELTRRTSCASRGSFSLNRGSISGSRGSISGSRNSVTERSTPAFRRRLSSAANITTCQRSISSESVGVRGRRVSLNINTGVSRTIGPNFIKVSSAENLTCRSVASPLLPGERVRRFSTVSQTSRRMSCASLPGRRSSSISSRRSSTLSSCSINDCDDTAPRSGRRLSVSTKQLRALVSGAGKRNLASDSSVVVERPSWGINTVTIQGKEPISLREKFSDWPEPGRIIKMKGAGDDKKNFVAANTVLVPYDASIMHKPQPSEEILKLELTKLGRGRGKFTNYNEEITVLTDDVKAWLVHEYKNYLIPCDNHHILYSNEGYVIRWEYHLEEWDGFVRKNKCKRCAYYFWQGAECKINEKGATALMTIELDKEKGPQIRVVENKEPPSFLNLFNGKLVIRKEQRSFWDREPNLGRKEFPSYTEMFVVRGECPEEAHLYQVTPRWSSLRSRGCFVIVTPGKKIYVWVGCKSTPHAKQCAAHAGQSLVDNYIADNIAVITVNETKEPANLKHHLGDWEDYHPLVKSVDSHIYTPRVFMFNSTSGVFKADEVLCRHRLPNVDTQFPVTQDDLYSASQPALFLIDAKYQLWLWQGWFETSEDSEKITGSARMQFAQNKKVAMETVNEYVDQMMLSENPKVYPIEAGDEPIEFTTLFPFWTEREDVKRYRAQQVLQEGGGNRGRRTSINTAYKLLTRTEYTLDELKYKPEGVDPSKLEQYLAESEFKSIFNMTKEEFGKLKKWKQVTLKQQKGLY